MKFNTFSAHTESDNWRKRRAVSEWGEKWQTDTEKEMERDSVTWQHAYCPTPTTIMLTGQDVTGSPCPVTAALCSTTPQPGCRTHTHTHSSKPRLIKPGSEIQHLKSRLMVSLSRRITTGTEGNFCSKKARPFSWLLFSKTTVCVPSRHTQSTNSSPRFTHSLFRCIEELFAAPEKKVFVRGKRKATSRLIKLFIFHQIQIMYIFEKQKRKDTNFC